MAEPQIDISSILLGIIIVLAAATFGEAWAKRLGFPEVLGELSMGILLGNFGLFTGWQFFNFIGETPFLRVVGDIGAIILLLSVGLHTDLRALMRVGFSSFLVAAVGVIAPAGLGFLACQLLIPEASIYTKLFLMGAVCVNSVGIAIRVFTESGRLDSPEARIVIAATLLDVIFIFILAAVLSGIAKDSHFYTVGVLKTGCLAALFLLFVVMVGLRFGQELGDFITKRFPEGLKVSLVVINCLLLAYLAAAIGMSPIVGAFGAGLMMQDIRARDPSGTEWSMEELIRPAYLTIIPVFFVFLGTQVRLESFLYKGALLMGVAVTMVAFLGKLVAGLAVREKGINRLLVGLGMVPRAEMALIIASMGMAVNALDPLVYSAVAIMAVLTSIFGLVLLRKLLYSS